MEFNNSVETSAGVLLNETQEETDPTNETLKLYSFVVNVCVDGALCVFGYFGNIMTIVVLQKDKIKTSNSILLQALAVFDCCFLVYVVLYVVLRSVYPFTGSLGSYYDNQQYFIAFVLPFGWTSQTATIWMVVLIALDRYIIVSQPLKSSIICTAKKAKKGAIFVAVAAILFNAPRWPHYYHVAFPAETQNTTGTFVSHVAFHSTLWDPEMYRKVYHISLTFVFLFIIPFSLLIVFNVKLITTLKKAQRARASLTQQQSIRSNKQSTSNRNVNLMMVIIISTFLICEFPDFVASIIGAGDFQVDPTMYKYYAGVKESLLVLNSSINFYLYCLFYKRFRLTLKQIFVGKTPAEDNCHERRVTMTKSLSRFSWTCVLWLTAPAIPVPPH